MGRIIEPGRARSSPEVGKRSSAGNVTLGMSVLFWLQRFNLVFFLPWGRPSTAKATFLVELCKENATGISQRFPVGPWNTSKTADFIVFFFTRVQLIIDR